MILVPRKRAAVVLLAMLAGLAGLGVRLAYVQGVNADGYSDIARRQRLRTVTLPAVRGAIYDRNGREIAMSVPARTIYANPKQIADKAMTAQKLAEALGMDEREIRDKLDRPKGFVYIARRVDVDVAGKVEAARLIGVGTLDESRRGYPAGRLASNVIGFVGTDGKGLAGVESTFENLLGGRPGVRVLEQDPSGRPIPQGQSREQPPTAGADLVLTLDRDIQYAADTALAKAVEDANAKGGTVVVMRAGSGEILAMANQPTYDPNDLRGLETSDTRNRAITDSYEPGSANKVVTAAAALEEGIVTPSSTFAVPAVINVAGRLFHDAHDHPTETMRFEDIIAESSNVGTIKVALRLGPQRLETYLRRFGYGRTTGLGFPGEAAGIVPPADRWKTSLPTMAIGQGVSVTALQIVRVFATVANDGVQVQPTLVRGWVDADGSFHASEGERKTRVVSSETASQLRAMLERVVTKGTGKLAAVPGYRVAGKTGTAQKPGPRGGYQGYMASFVGMAPADRPELVIGVVLDDPSPIYGGVVSAPVFSEVAAAALRILRIGPTELVPAAPDTAPDAPAADNDGAAIAPPAGGPGQRPRSASISGR